MAHFGIYLKELETYVCIKTCTQMFIEVLFVIDKTGPKQVNG